MPLIEVNNVENYGAPSGNSYDWIKPLIGVVVGYGLSVFTAWRLRVKERNKVGKVFAYQLESFKESLRTQVEALKDYQEKVLAHEYSTIIIYLEYKFDLIKSLDRLTIIKYLEKKLKRDASKWVSKIYNNFEILCAEAKTLGEEYEIFQKEIDTFLTTYRQNFDALRIELILHVESLTNDEYKNDTLALKFEELIIKYFDKKKIDLKAMIALKTTFHSELNQLPIIHSHPLHPKILAYNFKAVDLINLMEVKATKHYNLAKRLEESIREKYSIFYNEEMKDSTTEANPDSK
ncbi:MAG: hypothetical protein JNJ40_09115 [Bacteroidia bacterium]|nr:hypothetical protein [Bacteroidia bacterium]